MADGVQSRSEVQTKEAQSRKMRAVAKIASLAGGGDVLRGRSGAAWRCVLRVG